MATLWAACATLALILGWNAESVVGGNLDSGRYIAMADHLRQGEWLGDYNVRTLIRTPAYPRFLLLGEQLGLPPHRFQHMVYLLALLALLLALSRLDISLVRLAIVALLCTLHPMMLFAPTLVYAEAFYLPAVVAATAAAVGLIARPRGPNLPWMVLFWVAAPAAWCAKPEAVWLLPAFGLLTGFLLWRLRSQARSEPDSGRRPGLGWIAVTLLIPVVAVASLQYRTRHKNLEVYGVAVTHELAQADFVRAMRLLTRLAPASARPRVPVSRAAFEEAYAASPTFSELETQLARSTGGNGWSRFGCRSLGICDDIAGGWTIWAIRQAAARAGAHSSAPVAASFYAGFADDLERYCDRAPSPCSSRPVLSYLTPPFRLAYLPSWGASTLRLGGRSLSGPHTGPGWLLLSLVLAGGLLGTLLALLLPFAGDHPRIARLWPWREKATATCCGLLALLAARWGALGYIDALSFELTTRYLTVAFPIAATLAALGFPGIERLTASARRLRPAAAAPQRRSSGPRP